MESVDGDDFADRSRGAMRNLRFPRGAALAALFLLSVLLWVALLLLLTRIV